MIAIWPFLAATVILFAVNFVFKSFGPVILAGRQVPGRVTRAIDGMGQGLLAALVVNVLIGHRGGSFDATLLPGVGLAVLLRWFRVNDILCLVLAVLTTVGVRFLAGL